MIAIVHSINSQSVHVPALNAGLMDNDAERYCSISCILDATIQIFNMTQSSILVNTNF